MRTLCSAAILCALAGSVPACAVETSPPSSASAAPAEGAAAAPSTAQVHGGIAHDSTRCAVTPLATGNPFFCTKTPGGVSTIGGELVVSTDASYAQSCSGRAVIEVGAPSCGGGLASYDWEVYPTDLKSLSASTCAATYVDYTASILRRSTGAWTSTSARAYAYYSGGSCFITSFGTMYDGGSDIETIQISADAYQPISLPLPGGGATQVEWPVGLTFAVHAGL